MFAIVLSFIIGFVVSIGLSWIFRPKVIGYLKVNRTDPNEPYLFLEAFSNDDITSLPRHKEVILKVRIIDSQK